MTGFRVVRVKVFRVQSAGFRFKTPSDVPKVPYGLLIWDPGVWSPPQIPHTFPNKVVYIPSLHVLPIIS